MAPSTVDWKEVAWRPTVIIDDDCYSTPIYPTIDFKTFNRLLINQGKHSELNIESSLVYEVIPDIQISQAQLNNLYTGQNAREDLVYMVVKSGGTAIARPLNLIIIKHFLATLR